MSNPTKGLVECGIGNDVDTVIGDGRVCMEGGVIFGVSLGQIAAEAQAAGKPVWTSLPGWDPLEGISDETCPWQLFPPVLTPGPGGAEGALIGFRRSWRSMPSSLS